MCAHFNYYSFTPLLLIIYLLIYLFISPFPCLTYIITVVCGNALPIDHNHEDINGTYRRLSAQWKKNKLYFHLDISWTPIKLFKVKVVSLKI